MSRIFSKQGQLGATRPKIFGQWPKNPIRFTPSLSKQVYRQDKKQSIRAEQALHKSLMLLVNINNLLDQKKRTQKQYTALTTQSQNHKRQLERLSTERGQPYNAEVYELNLRNYYEHIRKQYRYYRDTEAFVLANLQNFDSRVTSVKLTRTHDEAEKQLLMKLTDLKTKRWRLQQTLIGYEENMQESEILPAHQNFQSNLQTLNKELSEQKQQQLHFLMQYQLTEISKQNRQFYINIEHDHESYAIYEAIHDSMKLMALQREEMRGDRKQLEGVFRELGVANAGTVVPRAHDSLAILMKNQKVYEGNVQLLARYNAETNLAQYSTRRKQYAKELDRYKKQLTSFKKQQQLASYLHSRHESMTRYTKRKDLGQNNQTNKQQKQAIKHAYYDCLNCLVPEEYGSLRRYRMELLGEMGGTLENAGILMPERNQLLKASQGLGSSVLMHREENRFHKYLNFFIELEKIPNPQKSSYLVSQKQTIKALSYQISQSPSSSPSSQALANYSTDFSYCQSILDHQQTQQDVPYLDRVEKYRQARWVSLPIGLDSLLFYYTNDVMIKSDGMGHVAGTWGRLMEQVGTDVGNKIRAEGASYREVQAQNAKQYPYEELNRLTPQQRRQFFLSYYHKISQYSPSTKQTLLSTYLHTCQKSLIGPYISALNTTPQSQSRKIEVTKNHFFTFRVLAYLIHDTGKIRLSSYGELIEYYIGHLERDCLLKYGQTDLLMEIVKQRIFIKFLDDQIQRREDLGIQARVMEKVNEACLLLYQANDHISLCEGDDLEVHMQHSTKLHRAMQELTIQVMPTQKLSLQQKCRSFITAVKKYPLTLGTRSPMSQFDYLINARTKIQKLKIINRIPPSMAFLSAVYTRTHNLLHIYEGLGGTKYTGSDVIMVRDHGHKKLYLAEVEAYDRQELEMLRPYLYRILAIYKGKGQDRDGNGVIAKSNYKSQMEVVMDQIIGKLEKIAV